jgi:hypothetical protein
MDRFARICNDAQRNLQQQSISAVQRGARNDRIASNPTSRANKALLFAAIVSIYQIFPPIRKGYAHVVRQSRRQPCRRTRRQETGGRPALRPVPHISAPAQASRTIPRAEERWQAEGIGRTYDVLRDTDRSEDRGPQGYCRIFLLIEGAS